MHEGVLFYVLVAVGSGVGGLIGQRLSERLHRDRTKAFLRFVRVTLPNAEVVEAISVANTDKQAIANIERRLRDASRNL
jgi:hypothetical protein